MRWVLCVIVDVIAEITVEEQDVIIQDGIIVADFMVATTVVAIIVDLDTTEDMVVEIIAGYYFGYFSYVEDFGVKYKY